MQNAGYYIEKNREIVDALIANYAFFSIFHCVREQIPAKVDEVHSLLIEMISASTEEDSCSWLFYFAFNMI